MEGWVCLLTIRKFPLYYLTLTDLVNVLIHDRSNDTCKGVESCNYRYVPCLEPVSRTNPRHRILGVVDNWFPTIRDALLV
jgi:hypothetical protein